MSLDDTENPSLAMTCRGRYIATKHDVDFDQQEGVVGRAPQRIAIERWVCRLTSADTDAPTIDNSIAHMIYLLCKSSPPSWIYFPQDSHSNDILVLASEAHVHGMTARPLGILL